LLLYGARGMEGVLIAIDRCLLEEPLVTSELVNCVSKYVKDLRKDVLRVYVHRYVNRLAKYGYLRLTELSGGKRRRKVVDITPDFVVWFRYCDCDIGTRKLVEAVVRRAPELDRFGTVCLKVAEKLGTLHEDMDEEEKNAICKEASLCTIDEPASNYTWRDAILYVTYIGTHIELLQYGHVAGLKFVGEPVVNAILEAYNELGAEYEREFKELVEILERMLLCVKAKLKEEKQDIEEKLAIVNSYLQSIRGIHAKKTRR
jgi:hypothetical protein